MHPDGLVMAAGFKNGAIKIYDVRDQKEAMHLEPTEGISSPVSHLTFSNKGLYLCASWKNSNTAKVFSLHKQCASTEIVHKNVV